VSTLTPQDRRKAIPRRASERRRFEQFIHDLNSPLTVLLGANRMLADSTVTPQQQRCVNACHSALREVLALIQRFSGGEAITLPPSESRDRLAALGVTRHLTKPFDRGELLDLLAEVAGGPEARLEILLVDDSAEIAWLVEAFLEGTRHRLTVAVDGRAGCEMAKAGAYDLVLMDVHLPTIDGISAVQLIREWEHTSGRRAVTIVAMTGAPIGSDRRPDPPRAAPDEDVAPLLPAFLERRRDDLETMYVAFESCDFPKIGAIAHRMKGTGRGYGVDAVSEIGARLEQAAAKRDAEAVLEELDALSEYLDTIVVG
jgi:CheY-like chemotaxis protein